MSAVDGAGADVQRGADDFANREGFGADGGADNVHQGVSGADFVEVDLVYRDVVDFGFGGA